MIATGPDGAGATCVVAQPANGPTAGLVIHLPPTCSSDEREVYAVAGEAVIEAIAKSVKSILSES